MSHVIALLACHNRRDRTVACLTSLFGQDGAHQDIEVVLVDDGSSDGTTEAARAVSDKVDVIRGSGSLFWARSMALAEERAVTRQPDYLLWLNDDVELYRGALETLLDASGSSGDRRIVAGSLVDPETGTPTYGGVERVDWHPMRFRLVPVTGTAPRACTTFNGNAVLVPRPVYLSVGGIDGKFSHAYADFDYGLRARSLGFKSIVTGIPIGTCARGPGGAWADPSLPLLTRYRLMLGRKGVPIGSSARYLRRHGGPLWPLYFSATYLKVAGEYVRRRIRRARVDQ